MVSIASENVTVMLSVTDTELWLSAVVETEDTVGAVVSGVVVSGVVVSELEVELSELELSELFIQLTAVPIIIKNNTNTILLCVIFLTDKDMIPLNNPSTPNIINNLGIIERS